MNLERVWKLFTVFAMMAILVVQTPLVTKVNFQYFVPQSSTTWNGFFPLTNISPTLIPTPTPTVTPSPSPTATNTPLPAGSPPPYSTSYYLLTVDGNALYNLGCQYGAYERDLPGSRDLIIILDFGSPKQINAEYGTDLFWMGPVTISQIKAAVMNFGRGYYVCASTDRGSQI